MKPLFSNILFVFMLSLLIACQTKAKPHPIEPLMNVIEEDKLEEDTVALVNNIISTPPRNLKVSETNYLKSLAEVKKLKESWDKDLAMNQIQQLLADSLIPYWYGTPWDFNGMATIPREGQIACGYFVFTLLEDIGFKLQRIKLSQATSEASIKTLIPETHIQRFSNKDLEEVLTAVRNKGKGIYLIGLDYHIGMLEVLDDEVWFLHSNFYYPHCVVREKAILSVALATSNYRIVGKLNNPETIKKWLNNTNFHL